MDASFTQEINFQGSESEYSVGIMSQDVRIKCSAGDHDHGSSKMKLTDMVDFNFGLRLCPGHLIAIHRTGQYIAYGLKSKDQGLVRVLNTLTKEKTLIKGVRGLIYDISFAFCTAEILLGFVDEEGTLFVYEIFGEEAELRHKLVVQLSVATQVRSGGASVSSRVTWCPYVPSYGEDDVSAAEHSKLLVLLRLGGSAEVVDVAELARSGPNHVGDAMGAVGGDGPAASPTTTMDGYVRLDDCHSNVVDASFSPDGTALATAGQDGYVKFFQVFLRDGERPRCLHEWRPHDGKALSSLLFLDNINTYGTDCKFWKFAVTGALNNSELKVWSCETWTCTQTIVFSADPRAPSPDLYLKARLDASGTHLLLTETNCRLLYVLQVRRDDNGQQASVESIAEFLLPAACISFCVRSATQGEPPPAAAAAATSAANMMTSNGRGGGTRNYMHLMDDDDDNDDDDDDDEDNDDDDDADADLHIHMYLMQTKCLQECRLVFRPEVLLSLTTDQPITMAMADSSTAVIAAIADATITSSSNGGGGGNSSSTPPPPPQPPAILKLDDLQNSVQQLIIKQQQELDRADGDDINTATNIAADVDLPSAAAAADKVIVVVDNLIDIDLGASDSHAKPPIHQTTAAASTTTVMERNFASGGSSPSREVQEILLSLSVQSSSSSAAVAAAASAAVASSQQQHISTNAASASSSASINAATATTYTPQQFFDSLTKLKHQAHPHVIGDSKLVVVDQDWPNLPKVSNIELEHLDQHKRLENRMEALEGAIRLHMEQLSVDRQQQQQHYSKKNSKLVEEISGLFSAHEQHINSLFEQHRRSVDVTVQGAIATAAIAAAAAAATPPAPLTAPPLLQIDSAALATAVQQELKCVVSPLVQATFDQLHRSLDAQHTQKLAHLDGLVRSNVQRLFAQCSQNKTVAEALSGALVQMVRPGLEAQYRDLMSTSLVPAWEKVCEAMFHQIHATFTQGTKEYCGAMEGYCMEQRRQQQQQVQAQVLAQVSCAFSRLEVALADVVREEVRSGLTQICSSVSAAVRGGDAGGSNGGGSATDAAADVPAGGGKRAPTPAVLQLKQQQLQVKQLLQRGGRNAICEAFQVALSAAAAASDTALVLYVCERVPVQDVFGEGACILPQHVLLSLMQQLGADLTQHTDLKHRYLEESLLNLDLKSAVVKEHGPTVLRDLHKQLATFLGAYPTHASARSMRMLHMVTQARLHDVSLLLLLPGGGGSATTVARLD